MAVNKLDPKIIFASEAPAQDVPAVFTNKEVGWGESRKNGGRPTIKQSNALQQETDLKILWLNENAVTPYDPTIDYPVNAVTIRDGTFKIFNGTVWNIFLNKNMVGLGNVDNTSDLDKPITEAQKTINKLGGVDYWREINKPYPLNGEVRLVNGDVVTSTIADNTNDPNVDMTGWVNPAALQALHNKSSATFTDYLTTNEITNSETTNLAAKLQAINNDKVVSKLRIPRGLFYINSPVVFNRDFDWDFDPDAWLKLGDNGSIAFEGSAELIGKPTANILNTSRTINIPHVDKLKPLDLICIYNPNNSSYVNLPDRPYYRAGEFIKVFSVSTASITTAGKTYDDYIASDVDIYKINPLKVNFNRFQVVASNNAVDNPVRFTFCDNPDLTSYVNIGSKNAGVVIDRCFGGKIDESKATNNSALVGLNYGVLIQNCQNFRVIGGNNIAARHSVTTGGGGGICSVPNREIIVSDAVLKSGSLVNIGAADFHGNTEHSRYEGCTIDHASIGGKNNTLKDCTIVARDLDGCAVVFGELKGGYLDIIDCNLIVNSQLTASRGALDFVIEKDLVEDLTINISNLKINGKSISPYFLINLSTATGITVTKKVKFVINGLDCALANHAALLRIQANSNNPNIDNCEIIMSNISSVKKGVYYVQPTTSAIGAKLSLPTQRGSQLISVQSGNVSGNLLGAVINLDYYYPVIAGVLHSVGTDGTWTYDSSFNLKPVTSGCSTNSATQLRFAVQSPSALPEKTFKISYSIGI